MVVVLYVVPKYCFKNILTPIICRRDACHARETDKGKYFFMCPFISKNTVLCVYSYRSQGNSTVQMSFSLAR